MQSLLQNRSVKEKRFFWYPCALNRDTKLYKESVLSAWARSRETDPPVLVRTPAVAGMG